MSSERWPKQGTWKTGSTTAPTAARPKGESSLPLQSCKPAARVLDEYSAYPTAPRVWGWVFGGTTRRGALQAWSHNPGVRRPSWHVEPIHRAKLWRFL